MSLIDQYFGKIPEYYNTMYMDGYTPEQIMYSAHRKMIRAYEARKADQQAEAEAKAKKPNMYDIIDSL